LASRSRSRILFASALLCATLAQIAACSDDRASSDFRGENGDGSVGSLPEAGVGGGDGDAPAATMRLAHLASDLGPIDFCYQTAGTGTFEGPVIGRGAPGPRSDASASADADAEGGPGEAGADAGRDAAVPASIARRTVSRYLVIDQAGPLTLAIVEGGATSCASPLFVADVTIDPGKLVTVALLGNARVDVGSSGALDLAAFVDDRHTVPDKARVRMIHAALPAAGAPAPISVRAVSAKTIAIADRLEPRRVSAASATIPVDELGYATIPALPPPASLAVAPIDPDAGAAGWQSEPRDLARQGGSLHTGFVLTGEGRPFEVVWCADTSTSGDTTSCEVVR
jgi:hypothetical protein